MKSSSELKSMFNCSTLRQTSLNLNWSCTAAGSTFRFNPKPEKWHNYQSYNIQYYKTHVWSQVPCVVSPTTGVISKWKWRTLLRGGMCSHPLQRLNTLNCSTQPWHCTEVILWKRKTLLIQRRGADTLFKAPRVLLQCVLLLQAALQGQLLKHSLSLYWKAKSKLIPWPCLC